MIKTAWPMLTLSLMLLSGPGLGRDRSVIVRFKQRPGLGERALLRSARGVIRRGYRLIPALAARLPEEEIERLRASPEIAYIEEDEIYWAAADPAPAEELGSDWAAHHVLADLAHTHGYQGAGVKVALLDTGMDYTHPELQPRYRGGHDFVFDDPDPFDDNYESHGTHVAGTIAAQDDGVGITGVAPEVELYALKVLDGAGFGLGEWIIAGIDWAVQNDMDIVNLSLAGRPTQALQEACDRAYAAGVLLVAAAGNSGGSVVYPAAYDSVIAVTATDATDRPGDFVPTGEAVELAAPGVEILSTVAGGGYGLLTGTSRSAAFVTGCAALYSQANAEDLNDDGLVNQADVRLMLQLTATDLGEPGKDDVYGYGLVNAGGLRPRRMELTISRRSREPGFDAQAAELEGGAYAVAISNAGLRGVAVDVFEGEVWREDLSGRFRFFGQRAQELVMALDATGTHYRVLFTPYGRADACAHIVITANTQ